MEIKAELLNPTTKERETFIVEQNHRNGYEIREYTTDETRQETIINPETGEEEVIEVEVIINHIEAWGYTEEEIEEQKKEHIKQLTCTKRVFALMLQELGVDYLTQLKPLIESNPQAQLEWDLCIELLRENPMLDLMAGQLGITPLQLDALFLYANGELSIDDFELYKNNKEGIDEDTTDTESDI